MKIAHKETIIMDFESDFAKSFTSSVWPVNVWIAVELRLEMFHILTVKSREQLPIRDGLFFIGRMRFIASEWAPYILQIKFKHKS